MIIDKRRAEELGVCVGRLEYLDQFLAKAAEEKVNPSIAISVARRGVEIFNGAYGWAAPYGPPLKLDMITDVQSVTKPVTATMVMMLQEDGLLNIVDPLQVYFPEYTGQDKEGVALRHLLSHVSGMTDAGVSKYQRSFISKLLGAKMPPEGAPWEAWEDAVETARRMMGHTEEERKKETMQDFLDRLGLSAPLDNKPYTHFEYCNWGYRILAKIVEGISGETMDRFARRRIFEPLGMADSHFVLPEEKWPRVLLREESCRGGQWMNSEENRASYAGSSGLKTTVSDLLLFGQMFLNRGTLGGARILSPASVRAMTADYNQSIPPSFWKGSWFGSSWGYGWNVRSSKFDDMGVLRSARAYDHAGYGGARLLVDPENDLVAAFYMVDQLDEDYILHGKVTDIVYSALD